MKERTFKKMIFAVFCCQFLSIPLFAQQQKVAQFENLGELVKNTIFVA